jgi:hypothetical protein
LSVAATAARSSALCRARSVTLGKYWRSSPLVFSLVPRCHGFADRRSRSAGRCRFAVARAGPSRHPGPGSATGAVAGQRRDRARDRITDCLRSMASERRTVLHSRSIPAVLGREVKQHREAGAALDERADRGATEPEDEIAFPVARDGTILSLGGTLADEDSLGHELLAPPADAVSPTRSARPVRRHAVSSRRSAPRPWT